MKDASTGLSLRAVCQPFAAAPPEAVSLSPFTMHEQNTSAKEHQVPHLLVFWVAPHVRQADREPFQPRLKISCQVRLEGLWV